MDVLQRAANDTLIPSHTGLTTRLRPTCDRKMSESWANRRKDVRLVAEVVGDRHGKSVATRSMVMFKLVTCDSNSFGTTNDRTIGRR